MILIQRSSRSTHLVCRAEFKLSSMAPKSTTTVMVDPTRTVAPSAPSIIGGILLLGSAFTVWKRWKARYTLHTYMHSTHATTALACPPPKVLTKPYYACCCCLSPDFKGYVSADIFFKGAPLGGLWLFEPLRLDRHDLTADEHACMCPLQRP